MKRLLILIYTLLATFGAIAQDSGIPARPSPPKLVNDFTGTLTPQQVQALEEKLVAYDDSTSSQIAVVIVNTTGSYDIAEYGLKLGRAWGVGGKDFNNGIIIIVALEDRKTRIEVGYGLEGAIPDITAKSIIDNSLTPQFREGNYYRGIDMATSDIIAAARGEYKAPAGYGKKKDGGGVLGIGSIIFLILLFLMIGGLGGFGGRGGGGNGGMMSAAGWIIGSMLGGGSHRGGGWSGGGGGWSGGGGGGGFGGFGGGSFGGGGASGSW